MAGLGAQTIKYAIFLFNLLILVFSIVIIASGGVLLSSFGDNSISENVDTPKTSCVVLIIVGSAALIISFLGCCGALKESFQMLYSYGTVLFILLVIEIIAAGVVIGFRNDIKQEAIKGIKRGMANYHNIPENSTYNVIDDMQRSLHCCGAANVSDWHEVPPYNATGPNWNYPTSCCNGTEPGDKGECHKPYETPCWQAIEDELHSTSKTLVGFSISIAVIQFLALVASCVLARTFKREYDVV
jgi:CD63 antigen